MTKIGEKTGLETKKKKKMNQILKQGWIFFQNLSSDMDIGKSHV